MTGHFAGDRSSGMTLEPRTAVYVDVKVLGILVLAKVGQHGRCPGPLHSLFRDRLNHLKHSATDFLVSRSECGQRRDVPLRHNNDVCCPEWSGVMKRQDQLVLIDNVELIGIRNRDVAVEVITAVLSR